MSDWRKWVSVGQRWVSNAAPSGQSDPWSDPVRMPVPKSVRPLYIRGWESLGIGLGLGLFALTLGYLVLFGF